MSALTINAWIERNDPVISLSSQLSGKVIACWRGQAARQLLEDGVVTLHELQNQQRQSLQQAAHELLLVACADSLCTAQGKQCFSCLTGLLLKSYMHSAHALDSQALQRSTQHPDSSFGTVRAAG